MYLPIIFLSIISCEKEEPFFCDKNAIINRREKECAFARIERTSGQAPDINAFEMGLSVIIKHYLYSIRVVYESIFLTQPAGSRYTKMPL